LRFLLTIFKAHAKSLSTLIQRRNDVSNGSHHTPGFFRYCQGYIYPWENMEVSEQPDGPGACNQKNGQQDLYYCPKCERSCANYCEKAFGADWAVSAKCRTGDGRPNNQRECICRLKHARAILWGASKYVTFEGVKFDYHGLCEHIGMQPISKMDTIPEFKILLKNVKDQKNGSFTDILTVVVPAWEKKLVIDNISRKNPTPRFQMNGSPISLPYKYSKLRNHIEDYIKIEAPMVVGNNFTIKISFGLKIIINVNASGLLQVYIHVARQPELVNNVQGILGKLTHNTTADIAERNNLQKRLQNPSEAAKYGDGWCVEKRG